MPSPARDDGRDAPGWRRWWSALLGRDADADASPHDAVKPRRIPGTRRPHGAIGFREFTFPQRIRAARRERRAASGRPCLECGA